MNVLNMLLQGTPPDFAAGGRTFYGKMPQGRRERQPGLRLHVLKPFLRSNRAADTLGLAQRGIDRRLVERFTQKRSEVAHPLQRRRHIDRARAFPGDVGARARLGPVFRALDQPRPDRIQRDIARRAHQMRLIHRDGTEPPLPQMPGRSRAGIDIAGIVAVHVAERPAQPVSSLDTATM